MLKIRRSQDRLIFDMGIPILVRRHLDIETGLCALGGLNHWGRMTHICVSKLTIIASDNGLSPGWRQAIIWNNAGILSIGLLGTNFSEILIKIYTFWMNLKKSSGKWRLFCLGLNVLTFRSLQGNGSNENNDKYPSHKPQPVAAQGIIVHYFSRIE